MTVNKTANVYVAVITLVARHRTLQRTISDNGMFSRGFEVNNETPRHQTSAQTLKHRTGKCHACESKRRPNRKPNSQFQLEPQSDHKDLRHYQTNQSQTNETKCVITKTNRSRRKSKFLNT